MNPVRLQLSRAKGFNLKKLSIETNGLDYAIVSRPSKWGNPFKLVGDMVYVDACYRRKILDKWVYVCQGDIDTILSLYRIVLTGKIDTLNLCNINTDGIFLQDIKYWIAFFEKLNIRDLKNKNLACWCSKKQKCHVDVILEEMIHL
jgi:hypothetical protein